MISIERAIAISATAHDGQKDKAGEPYIWHPIRVAMSCDTERAQIVAILHDVAEDTSVTLDQLNGPVHGRARYPGCPGLSYPSPL